MSDLTEFFLKGTRDLVPVEGIVITHPNFSKTYYVVRNAPNGTVLTHEDTSTHAYTYYPLKLTRKTTSTNLDFGISVQLGDLGLVIPQEMDRIAAASNFKVKPKVVYRRWRSDKMNVAPMEGPFTLEVTTLVSAAEGQAFDADAPSLNISETGEVYTIVRFPMLQGFI